MKKIITFLFSIFGVLVIFSGCADKKSDEPEYVADDPPLIYSYGLLEECSDGTNYCTIQFVEITAQYTVENDMENASGYFLIIGVDTSLSEEDMTNARNSVFLWVRTSLTKSIKGLRLELSDWDSEEKN